VRLWYLYTVLSFTVSEPVVMNTVISEGITIPKDSEAEEAEAGHLVLITLCTLHYVY